MRIGTAVVSLRLALLMAGRAQSQSLTDTVVGNVTEVGGSAVVGARVFITGTQSGSITVTAGSTVAKDFQLEKSATTLGAVAVLGSRTQERTVLDAPAPIDVLSATELRATGRVETAQMIQMIAPSFSFPRATVGDGTDHVRPATLRGLSADQVSVFINGKRRHTSALVNVNGFVGRGQAAVDLNAIPASMIDRFEILRDGAAAQYGSDAIAGVINIILRGNAPTALTATVGQTNTTVEGNQAVPAATQQFREKLTDGAVVQSNGTWSTDFGGAGFLAIGAEYRDRGATNRSLPDTRQQ